MTPEQATTLLKTLDSISWSIFMLAIFSVLRLGLQFLTSIQLHSQHRQSEGAADARWRELRRSDQLRAQYEIEHDGRACRCSIDFVKGARTEHCPIHRFIDEQPHGRHTG